MTDTMKTHLSPIGKPDPDDPMVAVRPLRSAPSDGIDALASLLERCPGPSGTGCAHRQCARERRYLIRAIRRDLPGLRLHGRTVDGLRELAASALLSDEDRVPCPTCGVLLVAGICFSPECSRGTG